MIRLLWRLALLLALAAGFAWLADHPGTVTVVWQGKEISTSVVVAAAIALLGLLLLAFLANLARRLWRSPRAVGDYWRFRRNRKGYESLSRGIIAASAGDAAAAARHAAIAGNTLADEPLVNVLAAQAAQLKGDRASVRRIFEAMTKDAETEALGLRGLFFEARQEGNMAAARSYAEKALKLNPRLAWASTSMLQIQAVSHDWEGAAATIGQQVKSGAMAAADGNRKQAAMLAAQALALEDREPDRSLELASRALKLDCALAPAALVAARRHIAQGSPRKAARILRQAWALSPHPDLAEVYAHQRPGEGPEQRLARVEELVGGSAGGAEGAYALARAAALAQRYGEARRALEPLLAERPQARVLVLMADIEEGEGDRGRAREFLARAVAAPRDPMWVSDGVASPRWTPVSPVSGEIVPCEWKPPFEMPGGDLRLPQRGPEAETAAMAEAAPAEAPAAAALPAAATVAQVAEAAKPATPPGPAETFRPPDDPGVADEADGDRDRRLAADG